MKGDMLYDDHKGIGKIPCLGDLSFWQWNLAFKF
jgi:hypothetical protein